MLSAEIRDGDSVMALVLVVSMSAGVVQEGLSRSPVAAAVGIHDGG